MDKEDCKKCDVQYSCIYLQNRFLTENKKCRYNARKVKTIHNFELKEREKLLKVGKHIWKNEQ